MSASPQSPHDLRDDRPDVDEAGRAALAARRFAQALRRANAERVGRIHARLMGAPRLPEGER